MDPVNVALSLEEKSDVTHIQASHVNHGWVLHVC